MMIVVMAVNNFMDLVVRGSEIVVIEVPVMMIIVVIVVVMVFDNVVSWLVVGVNMGIVVLNGMWIIEIVVSINLVVSSIGNNVVEWLMMHWLVVYNWSMVWSSMHWSMSVNVVWSSMHWSMGINVVCSSVKWCMVYWFVMWSWMSSNMWCSMNIMDSSVSRVHWCMSVMRSSEMSLNTISVLVMSVTSVVSWV